ncbi:MAG: response regulator, partial [Chloroflexi bacterium]|nr:response regulator [Chloroflexota bacterium]
MPDQAQARVLIVDDNEQNVALIRAQLERAGHAVLSANSGPVGLALAEAEHPDLIVLDVMMPGMDGHEVCRRLKAGATTLSIPVLMLTALQERADKIRALEAGADDFLSKPVDRSELLARVRSLLRQKRLYDEAAQERVTLAAIMGSMSDGLLVLDADRRLRYCNDQAAAFLGMDSRAALGATPAEVYALVRAGLANPEEVWLALEQGLARPEEQPSFEVRVAGPPQRYILAQLFAVTDASGADHGTGLVLRDITAERDLQQTKDELISVVSHELRTPLTSLVGFAELLLLRDYEAPQRKQFLGVIAAEGRRLTALINDFLDLQRMESGSRRLSVAPTDVPSLLQSAAAAVGDDASHAIVLDLDEDVPLALADHDSIRQVLANLLSNARKYSPSGGSVRVTARQVDDAVEVAVIDQGLGIPPEAMSRLFEKFYRVDNSDRRSIKGTGLGLAICRHIIAAHG